MFRSYTEKVYRPNLKSLPSQSSKLQWYSCDICDDDKNMESLWRSETDVELHRKEVHFKLICHQMKTYRDRFCTVCMTLQESSEALLTHIKRRHLFSSPQARRIEREIFVCDHCNHIFFNKSILELHIQYLHMWSVEQRKKKTFVCPKCKKTCQLKSLWFHMQNHDIPSLSVCDICLFLCPNVNELSDHVRSHPMRYSCEICNYHTSKENIFESHLDRHTSTAFKKHVIKLKKYVKEAFVKPVPPSLQTKYNIHHLIKGLLMPAAMHVCVLCREICIDKVEMSDHIARDHLWTPAPCQKPSFRCRCGAHFPSRVLLRHHVFKTKGTHREVGDNDPTSSQNVRLSKTIKTITVPVEIELPNEQNDNAQVEKKERVEKNEQVETDEQNEQDWDIESGVEIEFDHGAIIPDSGMPIETVVTRDEKGEEEMVYIYATVNEDDEMVTIEQSSGQIIGF